MVVRYRTVGDMTCTGAVDSPAANVQDIILEVAAARITERGATRADDAFSRDGHGRPQARGLLLVMDLLRFSTAGSVDDGKSTLIGRLLYDSKGIFEDQLAAIERTSRRRGYSQVDLALLTDGLRAEREQGITIDVAYRYFATPRRKFIIADTPGHVQYTRNMVTGASTADLAIVLIDARKGVLEQSRRHAFIAALLGIPHLVVAVNKMDLVGYSEEVFEDIRAEFSDVGRRSSTSTTSSSSPSRRSTATTSSQRSLSMPWYQGPSLLYHLENVYIGSDRNLIDARFPVQWVIRPQTDEHHDYRGYAGQVAAGVFRKGDEVVVLPSGKQIAHQAHRDARRRARDGQRRRMSVSILLEDDIDISRGDMICRPHNQPTVANELEAMVCWMADAPLRKGGRYLLKHTTRTVQGHRRRPALPDRRQHAPPRSGGRRAGPERDRPRAAAHERAADARSTYLTAGPRAASSSSTRRPPTRSARAWSSGPGPSSRSSPTSSSWGMSSPPEISVRAATGVIADRDVSSSPMSDRPSQAPAEHREPNACPFIALESDPERRLPSPDYEHRCFADGTAQPITKPHQRTFCLAPGFTSCPTFLAWAARSSAAPETDPPDADPWMVDSGAPPPPPPIRDGMSLLPGWSRHS